MDGKFAKYIQNFMQSYKISEDKIEIQTKENEKNKPLIYNLTEESITECENKLDKQYQIITDNKEEIKKNLTLKNKIYTAIFAIIFGVSFTLCLVLPISNVILAIIIKMIAIVSAVLTTTCGIALEIKTLNFEKLVNIIEEYRKNRKNIELEKEKDTNITRYLSEDTQKLLTEKSGNLDIDFMDKLLDKKSKGRKELITLLNMYKAVVSLKEEPTYIETSKKRIRTKEESE